MIQIFKRNHIKDAERFILAQGPYSCQEKHNVCGVRSTDLRVLVLTHHTLSFRVALIYRESSRYSSCSTGPYWTLSPEEQSHWPCVSWLSPGQWTCKCLDWITHFGPEQSLLILGSQHNASFFSCSLEQKSEGDSVHGKTKAGGKQSFCRKEAYDRTDWLPGTLTHFLTLVQTSSITLGELFLPDTLTMQWRQQCHCCYCCLSKALWQKSCNLALLLLLYFIIKDNFN